VPGTQVTLNATPVKGSAFMGWSGGGCSGLGPCVVTLGGDTAVSATFIQIVPTRYDATWSLAGVTYSNGDLSISGNSAGTKNVRTIDAKASGRWYWEVTATGGNASTNNGGIGVAEAATPNNAAWIGSQASGVSAGYSGGTLFMTWANASFPNGNAGPASEAIAAGNVYMFALDADKQNLWFGVNGTWFFNGDPGTSLAATVTGITGNMYPGVTFYVNSTNAFTANFGGNGGVNNGFKYPVPSSYNPGFYNIPTTWDPSWSIAGVNYTNGNLGISSTASTDTVTRTIVGRPLGSGRYYWELTATGGDGNIDDGGVGLQDSTAPNNNSYLGSSPNSMGWGYGSCCSAQYYVNWTGTTAGTAPTLASAIKSGNVYMFALDMVAGSLWVGNNGTWYSGPPGSATPALKGITGTVYPGVAFYAQHLNAFSSNFGQSPFVYAPPPGYGAGFY
jgi:hypothetical protein